MRVRLVLCMGGRGSIIKVRVGLSVLWNVDVIEYIEGQYELLNKIGTCTCIY